MGTRVGTSPNGADQVEYKSCGLKEHSVNFYTSPFSALANSAAFLSAVFEL